MIFDNNMIPKVISICDDVRPVTEEQDIECSKIFTIGEVAYVLVKSVKSNKNSQFFIKHDQRKYFNDSYTTSLQDLIGTVDSDGLSDLKTHTFSLFLVKDFDKGSSLISYQMDDLKYGEEIILVEKAGKSLKILSNCFGQGGHFYYFIENNTQQKLENISEIIDLNQEKIFGFCVKIGKLKFCLPIKILTFNIPPTFCMKIGLQSILKKVVYLNYEGSHCTGMLISSKMVLTVRHLFGAVPKVGTLVRVRLFPYGQTVMGKVLLRSSKFVDLMVLQLMHQGQGQEKDEKSLGKILDSFQRGSKIGIGQKVYAIGFGKFPYWQYHFQVISMLLPTITFGTISKVISLGPDQKYFKTDLNLYNGYSGSAIWRGGEWIGSTVFIVKNRISSDRYVKHNFNYCRGFIQDFLNNIEGLENDDRLEKFCRMIEGIHTRRQLRIRSRL